MSEDGRPALPPWLASPAGAPASAAAGAPPSPTGAATVEPGQAFPQRLAGLDGLRAVATLGVFFFHCGVTWLPGGFLGLDLFFVLSGYLITTLLLREQHGSGRIDLLRFWTRRVQRLLPALLLMVTAVAAVLVLRPEGPPPAFRGDALSTLGYVANWRFAFGDSSYFAQFDDPSTMQHTWSLAVEEQFYLLWPLVVIGVYALYRSSGRASAAGLERARRTLIGGVVVAILASAGLMASLARDGADINRVYNGTDTRLQSILVGALLGLLLLRVDGEQLRARPNARRGLAAAAVVGIAVTVFLWTQVDGLSLTTYRGGFLVASVATAAIVAAVALDPGGLLARCFGVWPLRALGRVSYAFYLWHWPIQLGLTGGVTGLEGAPLFALRFAATLALATASWFLVERPMLRLRPRPTRLVPAVGTATLVLAGAVFIAAVPAAVATAADDKVAAVVASATASSAPVVDADTVVMLGDSLADSFASGLAPVAGTYGRSVRNGGIVGCGVTETDQYKLTGEVNDLAEECSDWRATWKKSLTAARPGDVTVVLGRHETWDVKFGGRWTHIGDPDFDRYLRAQLDAAFEIAGSTGAEVSVTTSPYFKRPERPDGGQWPENDPSRVDRFNTLLRAAVAAHPDVKLIDLGAHVSPSGRFSRKVDGVVLRSDGVHFTSAGSASLAPWYFRQLGGASGS